MLSSRIFPFSNVTALSFCSPAPGGTVGAGRGGREGVKGSLGWGRTTAVCCEQGFAEGLSGIRACHSYKRAGAGGEEGPDCCGGRFMCWEEHRNREEGLLLAAFDKRAAAR